MSKAFVGIAIPQELSHKLRLLQRSAEGILFNQYGYDTTVTHGRAPHHITLVAPTDGDNIRSNWLADFAGKFSPRSIRLRDLYSFEFHTIFLGVDPVLRWGCDELHDGLHECLGHTPAWQPFKPHVSLARKFPQDKFGLMRAAFETALAESKISPVEFSIDSITLYREDGDTWRAAGVFMLSA